MKTVIALALTWDGSRWPTRALPAKARDFLGVERRPSAQEMAALFAEDHIRELRICWVPRLTGRADLLAAPFSAPMGRRLGFTPARAIAFGDILGVIYRR